MNRDVIGGATCGRPLARFHLARGEQNGAQPMRRVRQRLVANVPGVAGFHAHPLDRIRDGQQPGGIGGDLGLQSLPSALGNREVARIQIAAVDRDLQGVDEDPSG